MIIYVETSALLSMVLDEPDGPRVRDVLRQAPILATSTLTLLESDRSFRRRGLEPVNLRLLMRDWLLVGLNDDQLVAAAKAFPDEPIRTLDALHLAAAATIARRVPVQVLALDDRVRRNARVLGWPVVPV